MTSLRQRHVTHIVVDVYAALETDVFQRSNPDLVYSDVIKMDLAYGFVVARKLGTIADKLRDHVVSRQSEIHERLSRFANATLVSKLMFFFLKFLIFFTIEPHIWRPLL